MFKTWIEVKDYLLLHSLFSFLEGSSNKLIYHIIILLMWNIHGGGFFFSQLVKLWTKHLTVDLKMVW